MATARQCDGRRKISASKRWLFVKCKYLEAVEVENMEEPPKCIVEHPSLPADVLWGSFVTHSFLPHGRLLNRADIYVLDCLNKPISG